MKKNTLFLGLFVSFFALFFSCSSPKTTENTTEVTGDAGVNEQAAAISFEKSVKPLLAKHGCTSCHSSVGKAGGLDLGTDPFKALVGIKSSVVDKTLVVAGKPDSSYLIEKLENSTPTAGQKMPTNGTVVSADDLKLYRDWIQQGANL